MITPDRQINPDEDRHTYCLVCNGEGKVMGEFCTACDGEGVVPIEDWEDEW